MEDQNDRNNGLEKPCKIWTGANSRGYGQKWCPKRKKLFGIHKLTLLERDNLDSVPKGTVARHKCRNPACYEESHLEWGNHLQNIRDDKQRDGTQTRGEDHGNSKLTVADVVWIKTNYRDHTQAAMARKFGTTPTAINNVLSGVSWSWVEVEGFSPETRKRRKRTNVNVPNMKLPKEGVDRILRNEEGFTQAQWCRVYGVSRALISNVVNGKMRNKMT